MVRRTHARPRWLLLLLWVVVGALFVPPARPAPQPVHDEASPPALSRTAEDGPAFPERDDLLADAPPDEPRPTGLPELVLATDPTRAGPAPRPVVFALLRRPPPVVVPV